MSDGYDYRAAREAIAVSDLPPIQRLVLLQLVEHMPHCSPSITRLAQRTGCCERTVRSSLSSLEHAGWLRVTRRFGTRSSYDITPASPAAVSHSGDQVTPVSPAGVDQVTPVSPALVVAEPRQHVPRYLLPPRHLLPQTPASGAPTPASPAAKADLSSTKPDQLQLIQRPAETTRVIHHDLDGWEIPESLFVKAELDYQIPRDRLTARVDKLREGPIGGKRGVFERTKYVASCLPQWKLWEEQDRAKARESRESRGPAPAKGMFGQAPRQPDAGKTGFENVEEFK